MCICIVRACAVCVRAHVRGRQNPPNPRTPKGRPLPNPPTAVFLEPSHRGAHPPVWEG